MTAAAARNPAVMQRKYNTFDESNSPLRNPSSLRTGSAAKSMSACALGRTGAIDRIVINTINQEKNVARYATAALDEIDPKKSPDARYIDPANNTPLDAHNASPRSGRARNSSTA